MADKKQLLELRKKIKSVKPTYFQSSIKIKNRLSKVWRKPKGLQNKMRLNKKGYPKTMRVGYGSPNEVKHLDQKSGLYPIIVSNKTDLEKIDPKTQGVIISSSVGVRKKLEIIKIAEEKKIVLIQNIAKLKKDIQKRTNIKKKAKLKVVERKKSKEKKQKKVVEKKKTKDESFDHSTKLNKAEEKKASEVSEDKNVTNVHDTQDSKKIEEANKSNKEILQKRV